MTTWKRKRQKARKGMWKISKVLQKSKRKKRQCYCERYRNLSQD